MSNRLQSIASVGSSAQSGIANAVSRFAAAANEVAVSSVATTESGNGVDTVTFSGAARAQLAESQRPGSLEDGLIQQMDAKHDLAANVRVMQTADQMMGTLMSLGNTTA